MNLGSLPPEILIKILESITVNEHDLINLSATNRFFNKFIRYSSLWKKKYKYKWFKLWKYIIKQQPTHDWYLTFSQRYQYINFTRKYIINLAWNQYYKKDISFLIFTNTQPLPFDNLGLKSFKDELYNVINNPNKFCDLTIRYYAQLIIVYMEQFETKLKLEKFIEKFDEPHNLEQGVFLFTHWHQPLMPYEEIENVSTRLDNMANSIWNIFVEAHPSLHLPNCREDYINSYTNFPECKIKAEHGLELMKSVATFMYTIYGLKGDFDEHLWSSYSFINWVLNNKKGLPVTLAVIMHLLAKRVGLDCDIIDFPRRVMVRYLVEPPPGDYKDDINLYRGTIFIDPYEDGKFLNYHELDMVAFTDRVLDGQNLDEDHIEFHVASTRDILLRMARNLIANLYAHPEKREIFRIFRHSVEFSLLLKPTDFEMRFLLLKLYLYLGIELDKVIETLTELSANGLHEGLCKSLMIEAKTKQKAENNREFNIRRRSDPVNVNVLYSVGMIMLHNKYNYLCVITSWDPVCQATDEWKRQMNVNKLRHNGEYQPFYHVLVNDGTNRYAAQENLTYAPEPCFIAHPDVGLYFQEYRGSHYVANERKEAEFPEDSDFTGEAGRTKYYPIDMQARKYKLQGSIS